MKYIKIFAENDIFAVIETVDLGYVLKSLHGCESAALKAIKRLEQEDLKAYGRIRPDRYDVEVFSFESLFSHF